MDRLIFVLAALVWLTAGEQALAHDEAERPVPFTRLTHVYGSGFTKPDQFMVRNRFEWHRTWLKVQEGRTPYTPLPEIDFKKYMMLVVTRGEITVGGHPVTIEKITEGDKALHVSVLRETPSTCYVSEGYTYPTDTVLIAKTTKQIRWSYRDEIYDCPGAGLP